MRKREKELEETIYGREGMLHNCGEMGHLRRQCTKPQTPFTANRGRGHGAPFGTRRGQFRQNFGPLDEAQHFPPPDMVGVYI